MNEQTKRNRLKLAAIHAANGVLSVKLGRQHLKDARENFTASLKAFPPTEPLNEAEILAGVTPIENIIGGGRECTRRLLNVLAALDLIYSDAERFEECLAVRSCDCLDVLEGGAS